jgi:hypothetical protein
LLSGADLSREIDTTTSAAGRSSLRSGNCEREQGNGLAHQSPPSDFAPEYRQRFLPNNSYMHKDGIKKRFPVYFSALSFLKESTSLVIRGTNPVRGDSESKTCQVRSRFSSNRVHYKLRPMRAARPSP